MNLRFFTLSLFFCFSLLAFGCSKDKTGTIRFTNNSTNPYKLSINGEPKGEFSAGSWRNIELDAGSYILKAEQVSGFIIFPTVKEGQITVSGGDFLEWAFP